MKEKEFATSNDIDHIETDYRFVGETLKNHNHSKANILFIPGIGCEFADHNRFKDLLISYNYYAINLPAHGHSLIESYEKLSLQHLTNYVLDYIEDKKLDSLVLIGHGTSCAVVAQLNQIIPERIISNILVSPIDKTFINDARMIRDILVPRIPEQIDQLFRLSMSEWKTKGNLVNWKRYVDYKLSLFNTYHKAINIMYDYFLEPVVKESIEALYASLQIPTMVIYGQDDGLLRVEESMDQIKKLINNVAISTIPLAGNMPFLENPNNYYSNVISFVDYTVNNYLEIQDEFANEEEF